MFIVSMMLEICPRFWRENWPIALVKWLNCSNVIGQFLLRPKSTMFISRLLLFHYFVLVILLILPIF